MCARVAALVSVLLAMTITGCSNPLGRQYEYEEQLYLNVNGSAAVVIDSSVPALVSLRGLALDPSSRTSVDRDTVRAIFEAAGCQDVRVGQPWVRRGRRFVQIRVNATHIRDLERCKPLAWSQYRFDAREGTIRYEQTLGASAGGDPGPVNWDGSELVGFKLHAPSRIHDHNVRRLEDGEPGTPDRGNILTWEQTLANRRASQPIEMKVEMGAESILFRTLWLFAAAFTGAVSMLAAIIWITVRRARKRSAATG